MTLTDDEKIAILKGTVAAMTAAVAPSTAAIYGLISPNEGELVGSGAFLKFGDSTYLLTAAHVCESGLAKYEGVAHSTGYGAPPERINNPIQCLGSPSDLALVRIDPSRTTGVRGYVGADAFAGPLVGLEHDILFFLGYPGSSSRFLALMGGIVSTAMPYGTMLGTSSYPWFDPERHVAVEYRGEGNVDETGKPAALPLAFGLSGSLLWKTNRMAHREGWSPAKAQVLGVVTHWDPDAQSLVATKVPIVRRFLLDSLRRESAYFHWLRRGSPPNDDWTDWFAAEAEIANLRFKT